MLHGLYRKQVKRIPWRVFATSYFPDDEKAFNPPRLLIVVSNDTSNECPKVFTIRTSTRRVWSFKVKVR